MNAAQGRFLGNDAFVYVALRPDTLLNMLADSLTEENGKLKALPLHTMSEDINT